MKKRGQFYLIAALALVMIIMSFIIILNYSERGNYSRIYDIKEELGIESARVLDYGIMNSDDQIDNFAKEYSDFVGDDIEIVFITGSESSLEAFKYVDGVREEIDSDEEEEGNVTIVVNGTEYNFEIMFGENFYFVITQEIEGEKYVAVG